MTPARRRQRRRIMSRIAGRYGLRLSTVLSWGLDPTQATLEAMAQAVIKMARKRRITFIVGDQLAHHVAQTAPDLMIVDYPSLFSKRD